ncbi:metallo-beta-lactamase [Pseudoalteromonas luteoviolacea]|uniref:Ribonuclease Z n=1 Tax=Pseudoalteromonas luteoviolacea TaxID=43657 RepID=A0A0C1Q587_9GAMM|nr:ribonuclease Z [Pseudoalteromonas luteoviolacea]KID55751.1 metallo-beta-lactamase [Pseudoalteromonas luteoviolacea]
MQLEFLGTSSGSPSAFRNVSGAAVKFEKSKKWVLVDCGEGTQHQILKSKLSLYQLSLICISHIHGDHCYGLPGLLASMAMSGRKEAVHIVAPKKVIEFLHATFSLTDLALPFDLKTSAIEALNCASLNFDFCKIEVITLKHRVPSFGFKVSETLIPNKLKTSLLKQHGIATGPHFNQLQKGFDVEYQGKVLASNTYAFPSWQPRSVIVCGDNEKPSLLKGHIDGVDALVHEATYTHKDLKKVGHHTGHSDAKRIAEFANQTHVPLLVLTHFSARYHGPGLLDNLEEEAHTYYQGELVLASDGLVVDIPKVLLSESLE